MESILDLMSDDSLVGSLGQSTKTTTYDNSYPVSNPEILNYFQAYQKAFFDESKIKNTYDKPRRQPIYVESPLPEMSDPFLDEKLPEFWKDLLNPKESSKLEEIPDSWESLSESENNICEIKPYTIEENMHEKVCELLANCIYRNKRTRLQLEQAVELIEDYKLTGFVHFIHGLVHFPDLLERFLNVQKNIGTIIQDHDLACMFARCIEHRPEDTFANDSIKHLLNFKGDKSIEMKLLPGKYHIDTELYDIISKENVHDSYYDATQSYQYFVYTHKDIVAQEKDRYTGFRDAYHCLLYGEIEHLQALIVRWDLWGDDCTADAAREFFNLSSDCPIEAVKSHVHKKCHS